MPLRYFKYINPLHFLFNLVENWFEVRTLSILHHCALCGARRGGNSDNCYDCIVFTWDSESELSLVFINFKGYKQFRALRRKGWVGSKGNKPLLGNIRKLDMYGSEEIRKRLNMSSKLSFRFLMKFS